MHALSKCGRAEGISCMICHVSCGDDARHGVAAEEGDVRLVSEETVSGATTGVLQLFCDGAWGAVCNANFGNRDAIVACRQLGFAAGAPVARAFADVRSLDEVRCVGRAWPHLSMHDLGRRSADLSCRTAVNTDTQISSSFKLLCRVDVTVTCSTEP